MLELENKFTQFKQLISSREKDFSVILPKSINFELFKQTLITQAVKDNKLLDANSISLITAIRECAQDGLLPDNREAALVVYKGSVTYMPMIAGIFKKLYNSGNIKHISSNIIYENDVFEYQLGDNEYIVHKPTMDEKGSIRGCYAIIKTTDATYREVMSFDEIQYIRGLSNAEKFKGEKKTIWDLHWGEMAKKTVIRRLSKRIPLSNDVVNIIYKDENQSPIDIKPVEDINQLISKIDTSVPIEPIDFE